MWLSFLKGFFFAKGMQASRKFALDEFEESKHPRDKDGKFAKKGSGSKGSGKDAKIKKQKTEKTDISHLVSVPREKYPDHIKKLAIPPAWTDVKISKDPNADVLAIGYDSKGRQQRRYHPDFIAKRAKGKFDRVDGLGKSINKLKSKIADLRKQNDPKATDIADCLELIMAMGLRPGSERDTKAEKEARGASTLRGENVIIKDGKVRLNFIAKKGVHLDLPVPNNLAKMLIERKKAGDDKKLFSCSDSDLRNFMKGVGAKTKDLRTLLATNLAREAVKKYEKPKTKKEYLRIRNEIADSVSAVLGNTRAMALSAYIKPDVFDAIKL